MLENISLDEVKRIAEMAGEARKARDEMLDKVPDEDLYEPKPVRGEHLHSARLGLDPLPPEHPLRRALEEALAALSAEAAHELRALMWIGRGDYAAKDWERAVADAALSDPAVTVGALLDQADLHSLLIKGLYELKLA